MTVVNVKQRPTGRYFNNFAEHFFAPLPSIWKESLEGTNLRTGVPVNILETETAFVLEIIAPGMAKEDFKLSLENGMLTVAAENKSEGEVKSDKFIRREYKSGAFKRSFTLNEKIDADAISAQYVNGVLTLNLPKKAEVKTTKQITIN